MRDAIFQYGSKLSQLMAALTGAGATNIVTRPSWPQRISRWFVGLVACLLVFQAYAWFVVPWVEPPPPPPRTSWSPPFQDDPTSDAGLADLFEPGAWELDNPMRLKTQWGTLLCKEYSRIETGLELYPCTILFRAPTTAKDGARGTRTIIMQTPGTAEVNFEGNLNLVGGGFGQITGAILKDKVKIRSRETHPGANDALNIVTRGIQIRPTQIWTGYDVVFEYGSSRGSGRVLSIAIADNDDDSADASQALVQNLESLELVHVDRLHLDFPGKGLLGGLVEQKNQVRDASLDSAPASTAVDVTCQGPLRFDFRKGVATIQDNVDVVRPHTSDIKDRLHCDRLLVHFRPTQPSESNTTPAVDESGESRNELTTGEPATTKDRKGGQSVPRVTVSRIEAMGTDVVLQAPSVQVAARGQKLQYDFQTRHIVLQDADNAFLSYQQHVTEAPRLEYELHEDPKRLGRLWATGPGVYRGVLGKEEKPLQAFWKGTLELQPQEDLHVLSVADGADVKSEAMGNFSADKLFVWLAEVVTEEASAESQNLDGPGLGPAMPLPSAPPPQKKARKKTRVDVLPVKMLALGNVRANSQQLKGLDTTKLEIWFDHPAPQLPAGSTDQPPADETLPLLDATPRNDTAATRREEKQLELSGTQIRLRLWMVKPKPVVREATVMGRVRLAQLTSVPSEPVPLLVTGDMLQLKTDHLERSTIDVQGTAAQQARVQAQGMLLEGSNLHVSQRENLMWSEGPGRTRLPARANKDRPVAGQPKLLASSPIWISWQGGMDFDGQLIRFMKKVEVSGVYTSEKGEQLYLRSVGDQLHATLNRYVEFAKTKETDGLDVAELRFLGDVYTENQTFDVNNALTSQDHMLARNLTLDRTSGEFNAVGPGRIVTTRVDTGELKSRVGATTPSPKQGDASKDDKEELIYLRVDFQNAIQGNLNRREGEFVHFVRTVYGPVASWDQTLDPDRRGGLGEDGIVMTCNQLKIADMGGGKKRALEMSALGKTIVEGNRFLAEADRLTYVEAKDQLVMESSGHNFATLQRRSLIGAEPDEFRARKIMYWLGTGQVRVMNAKELNYNQLGSPSELPSARIR